MSAPFTKEGPAPFATYVTVQKGSIGGATGGSLSKATAAGNTLIIYVISNSSTLPAITLTGGTGATARCAYWSAGHGSNWSGIFYCLNTPAGITGYTTSGIYGSGYREVSGIVSNPIVVWNFGGNSTAGTTFSVPVAGATSAGDFCTGLLDYSAANGNTPYADGWTDGAIVTTFGQESYTTAITAGSGTMASSIYDCCSVTFKQVDNVPTPPVNWTAVSTPAGRNVTSGQATWSVPVTNAGDLLVVYCKTAISTNYVTAISGGGATWVQSLTGYTDNNASPHVQQCWTAKAVTTGTVTLTFTFAAAIGTTGFETVYQEFNAGSGPFQYSAEGATGRNNGSTAYITWPAFAPTTSNGELLIGFARVASPVSPYTNLSGPSSFYTTPGSNGYFYSLNMCASFQPQMWNGSGSSNPTLSYCTGLLIKATSLTISGLSDNTAIDAGNGTLGLASPAIGFSDSSNLDAGTGSLTQTMIIAASSATSSSGTGSISARGVITGSSATGSSAAGTVALRMVVAGSSATGSSASGSITALGALTGSSATGSSSSAGALVILMGINGLSNTSSAGSGTLAGITSTITGQSATSSAGSGFLSTVYAITGTSSTASSASGNLGRFSPAAGSSATASAASGTIAQTMAIAGNSTTATAASGTVSRYTPVAGMSATASSAAGTVTQICAVAGTSFTVSRGDGNIGGSPPVAGTSVTQTSASGALVQICVVSGIAVTVTSATGSMSGTAPLAGSSSTVSLASGTITATLRLAGSSATASSGTGSAGGAAPMAGFSATSSSAAGTVTGLLALAGSSQTASSGQGTLSGTAALAGSSATATAAYGTIYEVGEVDGLSSTASAGYGTLATVGALSGFSSTQTAGYGTLLPPFIAGLLPPKVTASITVRSGPAALVSVRREDAAITVRTSGAALAVSGLSSSVSVIRTTAKVTLWICKYYSCGRETTRR